MNKLWKVSLAVAGFVAGFGFGLQLCAAEAEKLDAKLEALRPLLGKTWQGHFKNSTPEKPLVDTVRWERALNGKAVRVLHSVNNGSYGGESLVMWDAAKESVVYHYFTTAGFHTVGTMKVEGATWICQESVIGNTNGVTEVKSTIDLRPDGTYHSAARYFKQGEWVDGREVLYREAPEAKVIFK